MFTLRTHPTGLRLRRALTGLCLLGVSLTSVAALPATPASAQVDDGGSDLAAARQVAERRAAEYRRQSELSKERADAFLADIATAAQGARVRLSTNYAPTHAGGALASYGSAFTFLHRTFRGLPTRAHTAAYLHRLAEDR